MTNRPMSEIIKRQQPLALPPTAAVEDACRLMRDYRIGAVLVTDGGEQRLVGIFGPRRRVPGPGRRQGPGEDAIV